MKLIKFLTQFEFLANTKYPIVWKTVFILFSNKFKALLLLAGSFVSEGATLLMAYMDTKQNADKLGLKFWDYVIQGNKESSNEQWKPILARVAVAWVKVGFTKSLYTRKTCGHTQYTLFCTKYMKCLCF